jgi:multimeric flavodoxin WrbA
MKVLAIVASGRKGGNVSKLCGKIIEGASKAGHETEIINLHDYNIEYCTGCLSCTQTQQCAIKDDFELLFNKEKEADYIIYGTPVYSHDISGILKSYIDRHACVKIPHAEPDYSKSPLERGKQSLNYMKVFNQRAPLNGKGFGIVVACSDPSKTNKQMKQVFFVMKNFIENEMRGKIADKVICTNTLFQNTQQRIEKLMNKAYEIGSLIK